MIVNNPAPTLNVIALDPGTVTGWATENASGFQDLTPKPAAPTKGREKEPEYSRCGKLWAILRNITDRMPSNGQGGVVVCEGARGFMKGKDAVRVSNELRGVVKAFCYWYGLRYVEVQPQDLQRFVTGRCQVPKEEMLRLAQERYGYTGDDDNAADALHLLAWARKYLNVGVAS